MSRRGDYQQIGDLVLLCALTIRRLSADMRAQGVRCPFRPASVQLEELSREIKTIADHLPADWDREPGPSLDS